MIGNVSATSSASGVRTESRTARPTSTRAWARAGGGIRSDTSGLLGVGSGSFGRRSPGDREEDVVERGGADVEPGEPVARGVGEVEERTQRRRVLVRRDTEGEGAGI